MVWKVRRTNQSTGAVQTAAPDYATGVLAYDAAWGNMGDLIKSIIRGASDGDNEGPQASNHAYKVYVEYRTGRTLGFELRYDYPDVIVGDQLSNSIFWQIIEIP